MYIKVTAPHCGGATDDADIEISQLKLELKVNSETELSRARVNFGKLYFPKYESGGTVNSGALNDTAVDYNKKQEQQIKIKNVGYGNLSWSVKSSPSGLTISPSSGSVPRNSEQTITLKLESPGGTNSNYSQEVVLQTDDGNTGNDKFTIAATLYDTPKIQHIPPAIGWKNNIVHVAVSDSEARFEVSEADPLFPKPGGGKLPVKRHEWQSTGQGASPTASGWRPGQRVATGVEWNWSTPGRYDLHCRMVDDNGVATEPVKISVRVWARPIVNSEPPDPSVVDWYGNEEVGFAYVGIVGQPVRFQGSASVNPDNNASGESISTYKWYDSSGNLLGTHGPKNAATHTWNDRNTKDTIYCKAFTNFDIVSHGGGNKGQAFDLRIYPELVAEATQPGAPQSYVGRAMDDITLDGYFNKDYLSPQLVE